MADQQPADRPVVLPPNTYIVEMKVLDPPEPIRRPRPIGECPTCGMSMIHTRLHGYQCPRCH
jgi:tRNA(Ile2) C34 agmatinyltransferase TiaS